MTDRLLPKEGVAWLGRDTRFPLISVADIRFPGCMMDERGGEAGEGYSFLGNSYDLWTKAFSMITFFIGIVR